jgi:hypothetical protein
MKQSVLPSWPGRTPRNCLALGVATAALIIALAPAPTQAAPKHFLPGVDAEVLTGRIYVRVSAEAGAELAQKSGGLQIAGIPVEPLLDELSLGKLHRHKTVAGKDRREAIERLERWLVARPLDRGEWENAWVRLRASASVERVEPAYIHRITAVPDDPLLGVQAHLQLLDAFAAYDLVKGEQGEVVLGIVDGGSEWDHEDLAANVYRRAGEIPDNGIDDDTNGFVDDVLGWDFPAGDGDPTASVNTPSNAIHGTHIAGIVAGVSDNGVGLAGLSWNAKVLLVNAGAEDPEDDHFILHGYEGLMYVALNGARIINASWGRSSGRWSDFEFDVVSAIDALDVLVIAAAGNGVEFQPFYPAYYPSVLSVTRVGLDWKHPWSANHDDWIEISAPGSIWSTAANGKYQVLIGTSQSAAAVTGVGALVLTQHPEYTASQLREHLRWTARDLSALNPEYDGLIGSGSVDPVAALTAQPSALRITDFSTSPLAGAGSGAIEVRFQLHNEILPTSSAVIHLESDHPDIVLQHTLLQTGSLAAGQTLDVRRGLSFSIAEGAPYGEIAVLVLRIDNGERKLTQAFYVEPRPLHMNLESPVLRMTQTANGRLGYTQPLRPRDQGGVGLRRAKGPSRIQTGSLLVAVGSDYVADALLELSTPSNLRDFRPTAEAALFSLEGGVSARSVHSRYEDSGSSSPRGLQISQSSWAFDDPARADFLLSRYTVSSASRDLEAVRIGVLCDTELNTLGFEEADEIRYLPQHQLLIASGNGPEKLGIGIVEAPGSPGWNWLHDLRPESSAERTYLYDPGDFEHTPSDADLVGLLSVSAGAEASQIGRVAAVLSAGPFDLALGEQRAFVIAYALADSELELIDAMRRAREAYAFMEEGFSAEEPRQLRLLGAVPNPFNPSTEIRFALPREGPVELDIYDLRGQLVLRLHRGSLGPGYHRIPWKGVDERGRSVASGVYFVSLRSSQESDSQRLTLIR